MGNTFSADKLYFDEEGVGISAGFTYDSNHNWDADYGTGIHAIGTIVLSTQSYLTTEVLPISIRAGLDTKESYAKNIDLLPLIPEKFRNSTVLQQFIDVANLNTGQWLGYIHDTQYLLDPYSVGEEYLRYLADLIGLSFITNENTTVEDKRTQLLQAMDWYKSKGTYQALLRIGYILGIALDAYDLYTSDYATFVRESWFTGAEGVNPPDLGVGTAWSTYDKLILHLDNNFTDSATSKTVTNYNVTFSNSIYKFGGYAARFNGTTAYLTLPSSTSWDVVASKFTMDCQVYFTSLTGSYQTFIARWGAVGNRAFWFGYCVTSKQLQFSWVNTTSNTVYTTLVDWEPSLNTWYHVQAARDGSSISLTVKGVRLDVNPIGNSTIGVDEIIASPTQVLSIGRSPSASDYFNGYMDEVRFQNGCSMHMLDFNTPTKPYAPSTLYYKSPHLGIDIVLNNVHVAIPPTIPYDYLFKAQTYVDLKNYVEKIRPVNVVTEYYLDLYPITDETSTVRTEPGNIKTIAYAPWSYTKVNFDQTSVNFDDTAHFFDYTDSAFLLTFSKWQLGTGNKGVSPAFADSYTTLLLHMDGANNSTSFVDSSSRVNSVTNVGGNALIKTAVKKFGNAGGYFNGTNAYLTIPSDQQLSNGSFETWTGLTDLLTNGNMETGTPPSSWILNGVGATWAREATIIKEGTYSGKLTRAGTNCYVLEDIQNAGGHNLAYFKGKYLVAGAWVYSVTAKTSPVQLYDGVTSFGVSQNHTGSGWEYLSASGIVGVSATVVDCILYNLATDTSIYFDSVKCYEQLAPTSWNLSGAGALVAREEGTVKVGTYSAKLTRNGAGAVIQQNLWEVLGAGTVPRGKTVTLGCWVYATVPSRATIYLNDNTGIIAVYPYGHSGTPGWEYLSCTGKITASATFCFATLQVDGGDTTAYFDGAFVTDDAAANFNFGSGDWTIDTQAYFTDVSATRPIAAQYESGRPAYWFGWSQASGSLKFVYNDGSSVVTKTGASWTPILNTWYHIEVSRSGNNLRFFINGVQSGATVDVTGVRIVDSSDKFSIGVLNPDTTPTAWMMGYFDEFRVSKGIARHTSDFTPETKAYDSAFTSLESPVLSGNVNNITLYSDRAEYEIFVPKTTTQAGISELGIFLSNNTTLKIASTFPDIDIVSGLTLRILAKLYFNRS